MKKIKLFFKILILASSMHLGCFVVHAQIQGPTCISENAPTIHTYTTNTPGGAENLYSPSFSIRGDVSEVSSGDTEIKLKSTGPSYATIFYNYSLWSDTNDICVKNNCIPAEHTAYIDVYKTYRVNPSLKIQGHNIVELGKEYVFALTTDVEGVNYEYSWETARDMHWEYPTSRFQLVSKGRSNDNITLKCISLPYPSDSIKLTIGRCNITAKNAGAQIRLNLISRTPKPNIVNPGSVKCLENEDTIVLRVDKPDPTFKYWWELDKSTWKILGYNADKTEIRISTLKESGVVRLFATNAYKIDTAYRDISITRRLVTEHAISGDTSCIIKNSGMTLFLYPAPDTRLDWTLPQGWEQDPMNTNSSSIKPTTTDAAISGWVVATTIDCKQILDSIYIHIQEEYDTTGGIDISKANCMAVGDTAIFKIRADKNIQQYVWTFPNDWIPNTYVTNKPNDTVISVVVGETMGRAKVVGTNCMQEWKIESADLDFGARTPDEIFRSKNCIHEDETDTITFYVNRAENMHHANWTIPSTWSIYAASDTSITVITNGVRNEYTVSMKSVSDICASSKDSIVLSVGISGIGLPREDIYVKDPVSAGRVIVYGAIPSDLTIYDYKWFTIEANGEKLYITPSLNASSLTTTSSYKTKTVCARISGKNGGCRSSVCKIATPPATPNLAPKSLSPAENNKQNIEMGCLEVDFRIIPNPSSSNITLLLDQVLIGKEIKIFNMSGACVYTGRIDSANKDIDIQSFANGNYVVSIMYDGQKITKKLQKN